jgi:hypothetical protein
VKTIKRQECDENVFVRDRARGNGVSGEHRPSRKTRRTAKKCIKPSAPAVTDRWQGETAAKATKVRDICCDEVKKECDAARTDSIVKGKNNLGGF